MRRRGKITKRRCAAARPGCPARESSGMDRSWVARRGAPEGRQVRVPPVVPANCAAPLP